MNRVANSDGANSKLTIGEVLVCNFTYGRHTDSSCGKLYDIKLIEADRWFPSSEKCSVCGFVHSELKLSERVWTCPNCGTFHDRDTNAGENLKQLATETALPVASSTAMQSAFAEPSAAYGGKVTLVRHDIRSQRGSGQEEKEAVSVTSGDHMCAPFR